MDPQGQIRTHELKTLFCPIPQLKDYLPNLKPSNSQLYAVDKAKSYNESLSFTEDGHSLITAIPQNPAPSELPRQYLRVGPHKHTYFESSEVRAAIVTCGGLCPGMNTVIRELVMALYYLYGIKHIYGIQYGLRGIYLHEPILLTPRAVKSVHSEGGSCLGSSRGGGKKDLDKIFEAIAKHGFNQLYMIGGDGTHRACAAIYNEAVKRKLKLAVVGIPKTVDNDIPVIDKSFGFDTAVEEATKAISAANVEAISGEYGIGLVKVMGRESGFLALAASLASRDVNVCLIPEVPFELNGPNGLLQWLHNRLKLKGHCVIVIAEGCGKYLIDDPSKAPRDPSGNIVFPDAGKHLKQAIEKYLQEHGMEPNIKYIDPTYMVRSTPANASDQTYCTILAQHAVHGAMNGFTGFSVGPVGGRYVYLPFWAIAGTMQVDPSGRPYIRFRYTNGQPDFVNTPSKL